MKGDIDGRPGDADHQGHVQRTPELEQLAAQTFSFMEARPGWRKGRTPRDSATTSNYYMHSKEAPQIALQITLDFIDEAVDVYLVQLEGGKVPTGGQDAITSLVIRQPFIRLLRDILHVQDDQFDRVFALNATEKPWTYSTVRALLQMHRDVIYRHIDMLLRQPLDVLFVVKRGGR